MHKAIREYLLKQDPSRAMKYKGVPILPAELDIIQFEKALIALLKPGYGLTLGGYAYYPSPKFQMWTASDGSKVRGSIAFIILEYGGKDVMDDFVSMEPESFLGSYGITKKVDQQDYEGGKLRGEWY